MRLADKGVEVRESPQLGCDGVVAAVDRTDGIGGAGVARPDLGGVVRTLAVDGTDRVDRGQIDDVEPHGRNGAQPPGCGQQRP